MTQIAPPDPEQAPPALVTTNGSQFAGLEERLGFWQGAMSLAVSMLGTGIVAFPYAFNLCGLFVGPAMLLLFGTLASLSYASLVKCTAKMHVASYGGLLQNIPKAWSHFTSISLWISLSLSCSAYVVISAHIIRSVTCATINISEKQAPAYLDNPMLFAIILALIFPLCLLKSIAGLSVVTTYCSGAIITVAVLIVWKALDIFAIRKLPIHEEPTVNTDAHSVVLALPILGCAMYGHMNMPQIYAELQPDLKPKASLMVIAAMAGCLVVYAAVGFAGYATFGQGAKDDIVDQMATANGVAGMTLVIQALLGSFVMLKAPLIILPLRDITLSVIAPSASLDDISTPSHVALTFVLLVCVYVSAIALPELNQLLGILGAVSAVPLCFVVPARLSWALEKPRPAVGCIVLAVVGVLTSIFSLVAIFAPHG